MYYYIIYALLILMLVFRVKNYSTFYKEGVINLISTKKIVVKLDKYIFMLLFSLISFISIDSKILYDCVFVILFILITFTFFKIEKSGNQLN